MSEDNGKERTRSPPVRLASVLSTGSSQAGSQSTVSSLASNLRETTLGGVQKAKFAPVVNTKRNKKEPGEDAGMDPVETKQFQPREQRSGRGRGRGRGGVSGAPGRGLLSDRRQDGPPNVISGPFSLGPMSSLKSKQGPVNVGFQGGISSRPGATGGAGGRGFGGAGTAAARSNGYSSAGFTDESEIIDLEKIIQLETLELGDDYCPVYIAAPSASKAVVERTKKVAAELIEDHSQVLLIQLPSKLPSVEAKTTAEVTENGEEQQARPEADDTWPADVEGEYGTLCVHESGKLSMLINGIRFFLEPGNMPPSEHVSGAQSIVAIDPEFEQSFEIGQVHNSLVASLDLTNLFK